MSDTQETMAELVIRLATENGVLDGARLTEWQRDLIEQAFPPVVDAAPVPTVDRGRPPRGIECLRVLGRPAPQGSKRIGAQGQMREQSPYLAAWAGSWQGGKAKGIRRHGAVERTVYEWYSDHRVSPDELPYLVGPVGVDITFYLDPSHGPTEGPPDVDKLARATFDALTQARVWEDDGRAVDAILRKRAAFTTGALIRAWEI